MKLFVSDLDGTLLGHDHCISSANRAAVKELEQAGVTFAIATGRSYNDAAAILDRHGLSAPIICSNGACVCSADGKLLHKTVLSLTALQTLCSYMKEQGIFFAINSPGAIYTLRGWQDILRSEVEQSSEERLRSNIDVFLSQHGIAYPDNYDDFFTGRQDCCSLSIMSLDQDKLHRLADFIQTEGSTMFTVSGFDSMEILCKGSTKADAVRWLAGYMGIPMEATCAIGDNYNDLEMLKAVAVSFAMENAPEEVRKSSTYITTANDRDGVAEAIRKLLNGGR